MPARLIGITLCGVLSAWTALVSAEQSTTGTAEASGAQQQISTPIAAAASGQAAPDLGAGDSSVEQARALFWSAHERYDAGAYAEAAKLFEESYAVFPQAEVLFNIALARARSGRCREAEQAFEEYLRAVGPSQGTEAAKQKFQDTLSGCSETSTHEPPPAELPEPGAAAVVTQAPPVAQPELSTVVLPPLAPEVADAPPASYWTTQRVVGWSLLGGAAAATGLAVYFDNERRDARDANQELTQDPDPPDDAGDKSAAYHERYQLAQIGIGVATATALGCAAVGTGLLIYSGDGAASTMAQVAVDPSGARIGLSGRF